MKVLTYITAIAAFVFGMNTTQAATIENTNVIVEATASGTVDARMDRNGTLSIVLKADDMQRALIQLRSSRGEVVYENILIVDNEAKTIEIEMDQFDPGILTLTVKGNDLKYSGRFKNK